MENEQTLERDQFQAFLKQRNSKTNAAVQEAQRLVNLYRVLGEFGNEFVGQYNNMLLSASDEVKMALKALVGGEGVRLYLEFLNSRVKQSDGGSEERENKNVGYLPPPEADTETQTENVAAAGLSVAKWEAFVQEQDEKLKEVIETLKAEQNAMLTHLMDQLAVVKDAKSTERSTTKEENKVQPTTYSDIIEE